jgi:integrase
MARRSQGPRLIWHRTGSGYYIAWTDATGRSRERSTGTRDLEAAQEVFADWLAEQKPAARVGPSDPDETFITDVLADYAIARGDKVIGKETLGNNVATLTRFLEGKTVAETPDYVATYIEKRGRAAGTVRRELGVLQAAVNYAHKAGRLTRVVAIDLPAAPPTKDRWLTRQEAARLLRESRRDIKARLYMPLFILIGLYTGRRKEAILSLRWPQIDLVAKTINFEIDGRARTKKRRGQIPIPDRLLPHLMRARRRGSDLGPVLHIDGRPIKNIKKGFAAACRRADVEGATPHTLKHTAASWLMMSGTPPLEIAKYLATSERMVIDRYGHHSPEWLRGAANAIGFRRTSAE